MTKSNEDWCAYDPHEKLILNDENTMQQQYKGQQRDTSSLFFFHERIEDEMGEIEWQRWYLPEKCSKSTLFLFIFPSFYCHF